MPGLAHFCEHLLFMGTKAFPSENEYSLYIKSNGGSTNAYTSTSNTCYYFSIGHGCLAGAIDRFSGFFHSPLFDPSCTVRELNAVNSEHKKNAQSDVFRLWQMFKSQSLPGHSWGKFGTGSWETLTEAARKLEKENPDAAQDDKEGGFVARETRRRLIEWWEKHYCASIMNLVVLGRESLDDLTNMALEKFSAIPNRGLEMPVETIPWGPEQQGKILFAKTVMDYDTLEISFPLSRQDVLYESKPSTFVSHFIGHEGAGSILSYLKAKGWVTQLWSGPQSSARGFNFFKINVKLTKKGLGAYLLSICITCLYHTSEL
jgi:insulysin